MKRNANLVKSLICAGSALLVSQSAHAVTLMGYFDADYVMPNLSHSTDGNFNVNTLSLLFSHEIDNLRFFAELESAPTGADGTTPSLERAWAEISFSRLATLKIGKEVTPTLWQQNHYPHIIQPYTRPQMVRNVFKEYVSGLILTGKDTAGFRYDVWATNNDNVVTRAATGTGTAQINDNTSTTQTVITETSTAAAVPGKPGLGAKLGWEGKFGKDHFNIAGLTTHYNDLALPYTAYGAELNTQFGDAKLWAEFATAKLDDTHTTKGFYAVASYAFHFGDTEISPFFMYDSYTGGSKTDTALGAPSADDLNYVNDARNRWALGVSYRPNATFVTKLEYLNSAAWNGVDKSQITAVTTPVASSSQLAAQVVYFFN